jgi:hypothetical protein
VRDRRKRLRARETGLMKRKEDWMMMWWASEATTKKEQSSQSQPSHVQGRHALIINTGN